MIVLFGSRNNSTSEILNSLDLVKTEFEVCYSRRTTVKKLAYITTQITYKLTTNQYEICIRLQSTLVFCFNHDGIEIPVQRYLIIDSFVKIKVSKSDYGSKNSH